MIDDDAVRKDCEYISSRDAKFSCKIQGRSHKYLKQSKAIGI